MALINGVAWGWSNITMMIYGVPMIGITAISYKGEQKKENVMGAGMKPISRGYGNYEFTGEIELTYDQWNQIIDAAPNKDPMQIPFTDFQVQFGLSKLTPRTDILKGVEFLANEMTTKQGDMHITVKVPLIIGDIEWGK